MKEEKSLKNRFAALINRKKTKGEASENTDASLKTNNTQADINASPAATETKPGKKDDAHWPTSIIGAFVGMLAGTLPAAAWALIFGASFSPLYLLVPLAVYYGIKLMGKLEGPRGLALLIIFTAIGLYLTLLSCQAAGDVLKYKMSVFNLPLVTITLIGRSGVLPAPFFSSANVFPVVFAAIGTALAYEPLMKNANPHEDASDARGAAE